MATISLRWSDSDNFLTCTHPLDMLTTGEGFTLRPFSFYRCGGIRWVVGLIKIHKKYRVTPPAKLQKPNMTHAIMLPSPVTFREATQQRIRSTLAVTVLQVKWPLIFSKIFLVSKVQAYSDFDCCAPGFYI